MILYYSGCGYKAEFVFKETNIMMSYFRSKTKPEKRLRDIKKKREKQK